jgi:uncharacterized membrane protein YeaQ/YmgE (transglycosylase-associated protein family)
MMKSSKEQTLLHPTRDLVEMGILSWIIVGMMAGWLAGVMMRDHPYDLFTTVLIGMFGAVLGGFIAGAMFGISDPISIFNLTTLIIAFIGAVLTVALVRALPGRSPV